uniref:Uncharacterized protein n=1 Tax=Clytia hemisphaerica TaxID=252671 RepID=A0A7M5XMB9_9CNID|eukprot:TCONS_00037963-protein
MYYNIYVLLFQFDETSVTHAAGDVLKRLGLEAEGDIIRLRMMCDQGDIENRKSGLKQAMINGSRSRVVQRPIENSSKSKTKAMYISLKVFKGERFVQVRRKKGGGCVFLPSIWAKILCLKNRLNISGHTKLLVWQMAEKRIIFQLVDERAQPLPDILSNNVPFTVEEYPKLIRLPRPKLYLTCKRKTAQQRLLSNFGVVNDNHSSDEEDLMIISPPTSPASRRPTPSLPQHSTPVNPQLNPTAVEQMIPGINNQTTSNTNHQLTPLNTGQSNAQQSAPLIGTSEERSALQMEIERALQESIQADQQREPDQKREADAEAIIMKIMENRKALL